MLKNYFKLFGLSYIIIIFTKIIFILYLQNHFEQYSTQTLMYAIFWGYKFDFATSGFVALIGTLFISNKFINSLLLVILFLTQISDILYFNESSRHIGYEITDTFTDASSLFMTALSQYPYITIGSIFIAILFYKIFYNLFTNNNMYVNIKNYSINILLSLIISVFFIRGMAQGIPLNPWQSNQIGDTKLASLSLNATYNIIYSLLTKNKKLKPVNLPNIDKTIITKSFKEIYPANQTDLKLPLVSTKPNIIFFFLESWSLKYVTPKTTPNYFKLLKNSLTINYMVAGGHRTTEGMFCTLVSYPNPLGKSVAKTQLQNYKYTSIIDILNNQGYNSSFFQGTAKETSGTGSLAQSLGFRNSYGKKDIKNRIYETNYWGVHDVDLYNFVQTKLKEPFVLGINGATTHDDKIPAKIEKINFTKDSKLNNLLNAFHFSDYALGKFIDEVEKKYPNTIFVLFADHCGGGLSGTLLNYQIPFAIYSKKLIKPQHYNTILSQRDIAPTILDIAVGNYKKIAPNFSGKSLISDKTFFANYYHNGIIGWIEKENLIEFNIATNSYNCFKLIKTTKIKTTCNNNFKTLKDHSLSFTKITQKLLFNGNIDKFKGYR